MMDLLVGEGWPRDEYVEACTTLGRDITWEPEGAGRAVVVAEDGALVVDTRRGTETIHSGAVYHVRT